MNIKILNKIKTLTGIIVILLITVFLIIFIFNLRYGVIFTNVGEIPEISQECLVNMQSIYSGYIPGEIVVLWNSNLSEEEANFILDPYKLKMSEFSYSTGIVLVQEGTELEWVCVFKEYESENIEDVFVNYRVLPTGEDS